LAILVVSSEYRYGEVVDTPARASSTKNSTFVTPTLSDAVAATLTVPETVTELVGEVMLVVGAEVSATATLLATFTEIGFEDPTLPAAS
jgi:hypothetical protein